MVGGLARTRPPRELADNPESWPHAGIDDPAARVVQGIARALEAVLKTQRRSLRQAAAGSGVNRQAIADLLAGRCWPDVATVARLESFLAVPLYPSSGGMPHTHGKKPFRPRTSPAQGTTK
ncbi:helix-turn-helix domain-containing protein [Streptomyces sp. NPDC059819]|uniref:helix-turn-helix domain-containing protein n=1 Tax=Streptomyces sp. NPDC059819 TaxID=3346963 RepID=UPI003660789E